MLKIGPIELPHDPPAKSKITYKVYAQLSITREKPQRKTLLFMNRHKLVQSSFIVFQHFYLIIALYSSVHT